MMRLALEQLAWELVGLAQDMRAPGGAAEWLTSEFTATIDRLTQQFDRGGAKCAGAAVFARLTPAPETEARDLFLIYLPEDRLPVAAPLALELTKRRVSVAFAEYEVATASEFKEALARGTAVHRHGAVLRTPAFGRMGWPVPPETARLRIIRDADRSQADALASWIRGRAFEM